jgi:hypothetical protein
MKFNEERTKLLNVGKEPILLEPVNVTVTLKNMKEYKLFLLDHSGRRTGKEIPRRSGSFLLSGSVYKTIYYELVKL